MEVGNLCGQSHIFVLLENIHSLPFEGLCDYTQYDWDDGYLVTLFYGQIVPSQIVPLNSQHYSCVYFVLKAKRPKKASLILSFTLKQSNYKMEQSAGLE